jgi:hypothetical protein
MRTRTADLAPDEREALRVNKIMTRLKNKRLRKCLTAPEWEALLFHVPELVKPLVRKLAVYHRAMPENAICPACGRSCNEASNVA